MNLRAEDTGEAPAAPTAKHGDNGPNLDESFYWNLLGIPPCKHREACNGCGRCGGSHG